MTELCYGVDLVKLMLLQAQAELKGVVGLSIEQMEQYAVMESKGHAIEARVYAENPVADFRPAPGLFSDVSFPEGPGIRIDTWLERGTVVTPHFGRPRQLGRGVKSLLNFKQILYSLRSWCIEILVRKRFVLCRMH